MTMTDEEWKEAQELVGRCVEDPWVLGAHLSSLQDKQTFIVAATCIDDRRTDLPGYLSGEIDDARDIEAMRRLFPKLIDQRTAREALIAAMPDKLRAVYEAARKWRLGGGDYGRAEVEHELEAAVDALEPPG